LFPRPEVKFAFGNRDDDLASHDLTFQMSVGVIFAGPVVLIYAGWSVRGQFFQPDLIVVMQP
jgi:hypothetical protein